MKLYIKVILITLLFTLSIIFSMSYLVKMLSPELSKQCESVPTKYYFSFSNGSLSYCKTKLDGTITLVYGESNNRTWATYEPANSTPGIVQIKRINTENFDMLCPMAKWTGFTYEEFKKGLVSKDQCDPKI